jgi:hypothetical protein
LGNGAICWTWRPIKAKIGEENPKHSDQVALSFQNELIKILFFLLYFFPLLPESYSILAHLRGNLGNLVSGLDGNKRGRIVDHLGTISKGA